MSIPMNRATKEDVMRFARAMWPSAPNLALASFDEKKALNDAADRIAELEKALRRISELDYANAAVNGAAYDAVQIAKSVL